MKESFVLIADPDTVCAVANTISEELDALKSQIQELSALCKRTEGYWQGETGTQVRRIFAQECEEADLCMINLRTHPKVLLQMAGIYEEKETQDRETAKPMDTDLIV